MRTVLVDWLHVVEVWVGANFLFGHDRAGTFSVLRTLGARYGFRAEKIDAVRYKDFVVSSTRIRRLIAEGRVDEAGALLGHHYFIDGTVVHGDARGREIGFPTANLRDRQRAAAAGRRLCHDGVDRRHRAPVGDEHRDASDVRRRRRPAGRDPSARRSPGPLRRQACACRSCSGCGTSARFPTWTRCARRSRPTAGRPGGCSTAFRYRIERMAPSPRRVDLRLTIPAVAPYHGLAAELAGKFAEYAGAEANAAARARPRGRDLARRPWRDGDAGDPGEAGDAGRRARAGRDPHRRRDARS